MGGLTDLMERVISDLGYAVSDYHHICQVVRITSGGEIIPKSARTLGSG